MPAKVHVQFDDVLSRRAPPFGDSAAIRRLLQVAARAVLHREHTVEAELSITLLDDDGIAALNRQYLAHDGPTDVIAFPLYEQGERTVVGDVYIGADQAARQAAGNAVPLAEELVRLTVHGVLHVLGHDHPAGDDRVDSEMWRLQEEIVQQVVRR
jgi:probable rRNA maturation factor